MLRKIELYMARESNTTVPKGVLQEQSIESNEQRMRILNPSADKEFLSQRLYNHLMDCENCFNSQIHLERYEHRMEAGIQEISGSLTDLDETQRIKEPDVGTSTQPEAPWVALRKEMMESEMKSMYDNQVWNLVDQTPDLKTVGVNGSSRRRQTWIERILFVITAFYDYEIWQMGVTAFLNGKLSEDVYMTQPEGFVQSKCPNRVCKLVKSIYGLKQASRSWNLCFDEKIKEFGFSRSKDESCVYVRASGSIEVYPMSYIDSKVLIGDALILCPAVCCALVFSNVVRNWQPYRECPGEAISMGPSMIWC
ncbi:hypothetical protein L2E82_13026 [Cichorium intybus]|uniref:Uncharacterized protein n=1 Tax=Cichorium intybus TaxID=13427 RepID=A0ACB9GIP8_CICIN|nr:hypothetical protein L2E82_13026 [Cichorium intybus]